MAKKNKKPAKDIRSKKKSAPDRASSAPEKIERKTDAGYPIVGIGCGSGSLEPLLKIFKAVPSNVGASFVIVPSAEIETPEILFEKLTSIANLPVMMAQAEHIPPVNHIILTPFGQSVTFADGQLNLTPKAALAKPFMPIDVFFRELAKDRGTLSVGMILSGKGSDGALGVQAIKAAGGITVAQEEKSCASYFMPRNAIMSEQIDFILSPEAIGEWLAELCRQAYDSVDDSIAVDSQNEEDFKIIIKLLRASSGVDFTYYKKNTLKRRMLRRMFLHHIETFRAYAEFLQKNPKELSELYQDVLIKVTEFFRDASVFDALKKTVFPHLLKDRAIDQPVRIWVPGCSTGEEVYSIAMVFLEYLSEHKLQYPLEIFSTDISENALEKGRMGIFLENIALDVSAERLRRFFVKVDGKYQIHKSIRDSCIFARQNLISDPPFSKLDLISCRNVLIYLEPVMQKKIMPIFHYALKPNGFLMLGNAESVGSATEFFSATDHRHKIFAKKPVAARLHFDLASTSYSTERLMPHPPAIQSDEATRGLNVLREADRILLARFVQASVITTENYDVIQFRGKTGPYFEHAPGIASLNLLKMVREGLLVELRDALEAARSSDEAVTKKEINLRSNGELRKVDVEVIPFRMPPGGDRYFILLFEEAPSKFLAKQPASHSPGLNYADENEEIRHLRSELVSTKEYLQAIIEEKEYANEELKSANEEIMSANEELQSTNEELNTAKEELQSANEELTTVNDELRIRNQELSMLNGDLSNLLGSLDIAVVMLGYDLKIRRFTPTAAKILRLIPTDVGRPITDIRHDFTVPEWEAIVGEVMDKMTAREETIVTSTGDRFQMRVRPYKTIDNKIDGAVIVFMEEAVKK